MKLNNLIQQLQKNKNIVNISSQSKGCLYLKPLDYFIPNGINRKSCIHIAGDEDVGKTSLALEFAYRNPDNIFIYVDTYFKLKEENIPDNVYIFRSNSITDIIVYLNTLENKSADFLIIDSLANLILPIEETRDLGYVKQRYLQFNSELIKIIEKSCNLNICLILLNTINGKGCPSNYSTQIKFRCVLDLLVLDKERNGQNYVINIEAKKCKTASIEDNTKTILLTGKGD
jgi:predicted ATP-dependent serine protease